MNNKIDISQQMATTSVWKLMVKLSIPAILAQIVNLLYNVVDRIYIGHMEDVGTMAITGVGLCNPIIVLISAFTMLIAQGGAPRAAIQMGKGNTKKAEKILGNCLSLLIVLSVVLTTIFLIFGEKFLMLFGASESTIVYALPYMKIYVAGSIFVMFSLGLNMFITTQGFTKISMATVLIGAICNIVLDPIFIFAFDMGVQGAALATIISQAVSAVWVLSFLIGNKTKLKIRKENLLPNMKILAPVLALGISPFVMNATEAVINIAFNSSLQKYGGDIAVGAMTICTTVFQMAWVPAQGIGQGAQPIISYNYGAGNADRVKQAFKAFLTICFTYVFVFGMAIEMFPQFFIGIFNDNPQLVDTATWTIRLYGCAMVFFGVQLAVQQTFIALGKAKASLFIACLRKVILLVPLIYILPNFFEDKVFAVFLAEPVSDAISIIAASITFIIVFTKEMKQMKAKNQ
ncbi:MAG: MATE family efflux transporter [Ruminococcaceae bacterium]|nr:MATE family efflux transporter [Oscillospiraceae bacterium]